MQGFEAVLKMMGVDPASIQKQMETIIGAVVKKIVDRFDALDQRLAAIETRLAAIEGHTEPKPEPGADPAQTALAFAARSLTEPEAEPGAEHDTHDTHGAE
jgi:hypothetical protein